MKHLPKLLATALGGGSLAIAATGADISVHHTGVDSSDAVVASGASTAYWELTAQPGSGYTLGAHPVRYYNPNYTPDLSDAAWVSPTASGSAGTLGYYTYSLSFDLTGFDPSTAFISGRFATDNEGSIGLNGGSVATTGNADFRDLKSFQIDSGFLPGLNTVDVSVNNGGDPTSFIVVFDRATAKPLAAPMPDKGSTLLMAAGVAVPLIALRRRRS